MVPKLYDRDFRNFQTILTKAEDFQLIFLDSWVKNEMLKRGMIEE
jgi:hypothetical protein